MLAAGSGPAVAVFMRADAALLCSKSASVLCATSCSFDLTADLHPAQVPAPAVPDSLTSPVTAAVVSGAVSIGGANRRADENTKVSVVMMVGLVRLRRLRSCESRKRKSRSGNESSQGCGFHGHGKPRFCSYEREGFRVNDR